MFSFAIALAMSNMGMNASLNVQQIFNKAIAAKGSPEIKGEYVRKFHGSYMQGGATKSFVRFTREPDLIREELTWILNGQATTQIMVMNGKNGWLKQSQLSKTEAAPLWAAAAIAESGYKSSVCSFSPLIDTKKFEFDILPDSKVDDETCFGIRIKSEGRQNIDVYIGKDTYLLRKVVSKRPVENGKFNEWVEVLSDYKSFKGCKSPTKITLHIDQVPIREQIVSDIEYIPLKDVEHLFEKPE